MARHSEEECAYCERDLLPLSYIVGEDGHLYCSVKCADVGERQAREQRQPGTEARIVNCR